MPVVSAKKFFTTLLWLLIPNGFNSVDPLKISIDWVVTNALVVLLEEVTNKNFKESESDVSPEPEYLDV